MLLLVDARDPIPALAKVVDPHGILIPLETSDPVLDAMREGKVLTIQTEGMKVSFKLTGTRDAIAELAACVTENQDHGEGRAADNARASDYQRRENSFSMSVSLSSI